MSNITFDTARAQVSLFSNQSKGLRHHHEAMECRDCEDFLQIGIDAFSWIERAHENLRRRIYEGTATFDPEVEDALTTLYESWLLSCTDAEKWISIQQSRGYYPDNLTEFRHCQEEVRDILEQRTLARKSRLARLSPTTTEDGTVDES